MVYRKLESSNNSEKDEYNSSLFSSLANQMIRDGENEFTDKQALIEAIKEIAKRT